MSPDRPGLLIHNASEVATLAGGIRRGVAQGDVGLLMADGADDANRPAVAAYEGRIVAVGRLAEVERELAALGIAAGALERLDARRGTVTPGLVDPHTHLLFAGTRHAEVELRQRGHSYLEVLAAGGGILQTVRQTRAATDEELLIHGRRWLAEMASHGVTTAEVKSGYGLDTASELRLLSLYGQLEAEGPVELVPTFLGAHAVAPEFRDRPNAARAYMDSVISEQLPAVAEQGIAKSCDVFCERGVFEADEARRLLTRAAELGLATRLHADELQPSGGAELAAEIGALSADHLGAISDAGVDALAAAADRDRPTVATLLPLTTFYLDEPAFAPARRLIERGIPVALGTDFNPGTSPAPNAQLALAFAVHRLQMSAAEALAAMTINAAAALGMDHSHGSIEVGKHADLVVWDPDSLSLLPYWLGANLARVVVKRGRVAYARPD
ncbi:MAG TPA: imidazolonepropionase [Candidatus Limnocylindrales bacterium]|nr:imidazolonepropionase [Candidatus Limnocylindrales bacterium]